MVFIAVHLGAGVHSQKLSKRYKAICNEACRLGTHLLISHPSPSAQTVAATVCKFLEDSNLTNAGTGSNLTAAGTIECDASIMSSEFCRGAAVGCISGVRNPVLVAERLLRQSFVPLSAGRVAPLFLVGDGALQFAKAQDMELATTEDLSTRSSIIRYEYWNEILDPSTDNDPEEAAHRGDDEVLCDLITDTVGVICVDVNGEIAVASSSGGVAMKQQGRIGPAALVGSGIWAAKDDAGSKVAVCTSGTGEDIMSTNLASRCAQTLLRPPTTSPSDDQDELRLVSSLLSTDFSNSPALQLRPASAGILAVKTELGNEDGGNDVLLQAVYGHTTKSMCVGFMTPDWGAPKVTISRNETGAPTVSGLVARMRL
ncbi:nucleophile aminohydrolase [Myxozyma melibiosi]|uniref:Nucleophile aminohydrolase n=1 Tax=Myxozyma melibiosi TaxID=54550 RepID=A0ABR1FCH9_9ASCO